MGAGGSRGCGEGLSLPSGFTCQKVVTGLSAPRFIIVVPTAAAANGETSGEACGGFELLIAERDGGNIVAYDGISAEVLVSGLNKPTSIDQIGPTSFIVGEGDALSRIDVDNTSEWTRTVLADLPEGGQHHSRTVLLGPDKRHIYVSIGSTCNSCIERDPRRATVMQFDLGKRTPSAPEGRERLIRR